MAAAQGEGVPVMELETLAGAASPTLGVDVTASAAVPLVDGPPDRCRDVAGGRWLLSHWRRLARGLRAAEPAGLEPLELLGDRRVDDRRQVAVGHRGAHERTEPVELVAQFGAGGELDLVAARRQGFDGLWRSASPRAELSPVSSNCVWTQFRSRDINSVWTQLTFRRDR
jgi:hypothetical protein